MSNKQETYVVKFKAQAEGLDNIIKDIAKIAQGGDIKLTDGMSKDLQKLQAQAKLLMDSLNGELSKESPNTDILKSLHNEFMQLTSQAQKFGLTLSSLVVPKDLQASLEETTNSLKEQERQLRNLKKQYSTATSKFTVGDNGQLVPTAKAEDMAFNKAGGKRLDTLGNQYNGSNQFQTAQQVEELRNKLVEQNKTLAETDEQYQKNAQSIRELDDFLTRYKQKLNEVVQAAKTKADETRQGIITQEDVVKQTKAEIAGIQDKIRAQAGEEASSTKIVELTGKVAEIRSDHSDALQKEKDRQNALAQAEKEAALQQKNTQKALDDATNSLERQNKSLNTNTTTFGRAAKQVFTYGTALNILKRLYTETIKTITDMDEALTGMAIVTTMSREQTWGLVGDLQELANTTGKTTTEIANMATKFYQQGKSTTQVMQLTEAAAKAATIAGIDGSRSIDLLTNAMNGFQMSSSKAMEVSDKFASLAASAATDYEELATALSKVAAQANLAGMSMDFTLGLLTKGIEVTREAPETIGTALKTVVARMRELTDYGKTLEDGMDVNRVAKALSNIGIEMMDEQGQFRDLETVLTEVGMKWDTLNKNQQANVAVALAGTRQQSRLIAMMQDFDRTLELVDISANSYGATMAQSAKYMEGLEAKMTLLTNAWQKFITSLVNSDLVINGVGLITEAVTLITDNLWAIYPILGFIAANALATAASNREQAALEAESAAWAAKKHQSELRELITSRKQKIEELNHNKIISEQLIQELAKEKSGLRQTAIKEKQKILDDKTLSDSAKTLKIKNLEKECENEINKLDKEIGVEKQKILEYERDINEAERQQSRDQLAISESQKAEEQARLQSLTGIFGVLQAIIPVMTTIQALQKIGLLFDQKANKEKLKGLALQLQEQAREKKGFKQKMLNAAADMADSAADIPFWGWAIAIAILAAVGIGIAVAVNKAQAMQNTIADTTDSLNEFQAELYNLNQSITTVHKLGDEFETLSSKIIKSTEDLERLKEIADQVNDQAGYNIVDTTADVETQLLQIRGYEEAQKARHNKTVSKAESRLGSGLWGAAYLKGHNNAKKDDTFKIWDIFAPGWANRIENDIEAKKSAKEFVQDVKFKKDYIEQLGSAGLATIRSVAQNEIIGLANFSTETQNILKDTYVSMAADMLTKDGLNSEMFNKLFGQYANELDEVVKDGSMTNYYNFMVKLRKENEQAFNTFKEANTIFSGIYDLGSKNIEAMETYNLSIDEVNKAWVMMKKVAESTGQAVNDIFKNMIQSANTYLDEGFSNTDAFYKAQVDAIMQAQEYAQSEKGQEEYKNLQKDASNKQNELQKAIDAEEAAKEKSSYDAESKDAQKLRDAVDQASQSYAGAAEAVEAFEDAAAGSPELMAQLKEAFLIEKPISDYSDALTKLGSTLERISKVGDIAKMSFEEQMKLLNDYPSLLGAMQNGTLDAATAWNILKDEFNDTMQTMKDDLHSTELEYSVGNENALIMDAFGANIFTEEQAERLKDIFNKGQAAFLNSDAGKALGDSAATVWGDIEDTMQKRYALDLMEENGFALSLNVQLDDPKLTAYEKLVAQAEEFDERLGRVNETSEEYTQLLLDQIDIYKNLAQESLKMMDDADNTGLKAIFGDISETDFQAIMGAIRIENGMLIEDAEALADLNEDQIGLYKMSKEQLVEYAKDQQEYYDKAVEYATKAAEAQIAAATREKEAQIEALEERKAALEQYFSEVDALDAEADRAEQHDSLVTQIAALTGALDGSSKSKIKELQAELRQLQEEELQAQKERQRDALYQNIDMHIENLNTEIEDLNSRLGEYTNAILRTLGVEDEQLLPTANLDNSTVNAKGGLVNYTGLAWVDGTPTQPEAFLSATDVRLIQDLVSSLKLTPVENTSGGVAIGEINIHTDHLDNNQDFAQAGETLAEAFDNAIRRRGINVNAKR